MEPTRTYFGTDGIRGVVGETLTADLVRRLGCAFGLSSASKRVLVGRDTRNSGERLERVFAAGIEDAGAVAELGGILPTPAVALLAEGEGAVITASHNPPIYNGVKFFAQGGNKLSDKEELDIENLLEANGPKGGEVILRNDLGENYVDLILDRFGSPLDGLNLVLDCAHGALSGLAELAFEDLGAKVTVIGSEPDGNNINVGCGATDLSKLSSVVGSGNHDLGLAFDGDGDRVVAVDSRGSVIDGDALLAILSLSLEVDTVAVTVMTNSGFHELMASRGIKVLTTDVGDRCILRALKTNGALLGGEQSGHIVYLDGHTTGDGLAAGLLLCRALVESGRTLAEEAAFLHRWPQVNASIEVSTKLLTSAITQVVQEINAKYEGEARVLVRPSGTEELVRVFVEARDESLVDSLCDKLCALVKQELG